MQPRTKFTLIANRMCDRKLSTTLVRLQMFKQSFVNVSFSRFVQRVVDVAGASNPR